MLPWGWRDGLNGQEHRLLLQRTRAQFPASTWQPTTPVSGDLTPSHNHTGRQNTNAHEIKKILKQKRFMFPKCLGGSTLETTAQIWDGENKILNQ